MQDKTINTPISKKDLLFLTGLLFLIIKVARRHDSREPGARTEGIQEAGQIK
jgi:hypothetical protein